MSDPYATISTMMTNSKSSHSFQTMLNATITLNDDGTISIETRLTEADRREIAAVLGVNVGHAA